MEECMSEQNNQADQNKQWGAKAKAQDSAERKEDYMVLILAGITVVLVVTGVLGPNFMKSLFF
jgi:hypothetical protein